MRIIVIRMVAMLQNNIAVNRLCNVA